MTPLSESDTTILRAIGHDTIVKIVALCIEAVLWAIYNVLIIKAGHILLQPDRPRSTTYIFGVLILMLSMDTVLCIIDVHEAIRELTLTLTSTSDKSLADRYSLISTLPWALACVIYSFMNNLGDAIIIWRVYAFYRYSRMRYIIMVPLALLLSSLAVSVLLSFCAGHWNDDINITRLSRIGTPLCTGVVDVQLALYCSTLATTATTTLMMMLKLWQYRRDIAIDLRSATSRRTLSERIMVVLVESGILYFLFLLQAVITDSSNTIIRGEEATPTLALAWTIWVYMASHILGIYPIIIVILAHSQRSFLDTISSQSKPNEISESTSV